MTAYREFMDLPVPKYYQVYLAIKEKVDSGEYLPGTAIPSERQMVDLFGVSRITVVKAIDLLVQEGLIDRRQGIGNFVRGSNIDLEPPLRNLAFVIPGILEGYISTVLMGVIREASKYSIQVQVISPKLGGRLNMLDENCCDAVDGAIIYPAEQGWHDWIARLIDRKLPLVLIDRYFTDLPCDHVVFDDETAAYELTSRLLHHGYHRIAFLTQSEVNTTSVIDRLKGYQRALIEGGIPIDEDLLWLDMYSHLSVGIDLLRDDFSESLNRHIHKYHPDAVFAINHRVMEKFYFDLVSLQNSQLLAQIGGVDAETRRYSIAQAGVCDHDVDFINPHYQCVAMQSGVDLGMEAFKVLWERMTGSQKSEEPIHRVNPMKIVEISRNDSA